MSTPKAYSYVRFSTAEQAAGDSRRRQTDLAADYVKRHGLTLDIELNMRDLGVSAFKGKNLEETAALGAFRRGIEDGMVEPGSVLLVESLDRISRQNQRKGLRILEEIVEAGVDVVTLNDGKRWNLEAINGFDFMLAFAVLFRAHEESSTKSKRNAAAQASKRERAKERGEIMTSQAPKWLKVTGAATKDAGHNAKLSLIPDRVKILKRIFREFNAGAGCGKIARSLTADRVPTFGAAAEWNPKYVFKVLRWRAVLGEFDPCKAGEPQGVIKGYFPRAVDTETFDQAQALIESRQGHAPRSSRLVMNILSQLGVCPKCGTHMRRKNRGSGKKAGRVKLVCSRADHGGKCDYVTVDLTEIEEAFRRWDCKIPRRDATLDASIKATETDKGALEFDIYNLVNSIARRPSAALSKRLAEYEARLERVTAELADLQRQAGESDSRVLKQRAANLKAALSADTLNRAAINVALRTMLTKVVVEYATAELVLFWKHDGQTRLDTSDKRIAAKEWAAINR